MSDTRSPEERRRIAVHEAAHAAAAWCLSRGHRPTGPVSIRPGRQFGGIAIVGRGSVKWPASDPGEGVLPMVLAPDARRRTVEREGIITLAGPAAEDIAFESSRFQEPDELAVERIAAAVTLTPREARNLEDLEGLEAEERRMVPDREWARDLVDVIAGSIASSYFQWLQTATYRLLANDTVRELIDALADELVTHEAVSKRGVHEIFHASSRPWFRELLKIERRQ